MPVLFYSYIKNKGPNLLVRLPILASDFCCGSFAPKMRTAESLQISIFHYTFVLLCSAFSLHYETSVNSQGHGVIILWLLICGAQRTKKVISFFPVNYQVSS